MNSITQNILISHDLIGFIYGEMVVCSIIICKIQAVWIQLARKYFEEKITKQKIWKFGGNFAYIFFIKREFLEPSHSLLLPKRLRAFLATQLYFAGSIACLGQNHTHASTTMQKQQ